MKLEEKLANLRKEKGLTQQIVAEELDISRQAISRWEAGVAMPSSDNLRSLSVLYGVPVDYLLNDESERPAQAAEAVDQKQKKKRWPIYLACLLVLIAAIAAVLIMTDAGDQERVGLHTTEREDWSDSSKEDFQIN